MKTKIILNGKLAKLYGKEFEFANIKKPIQAIEALETRFPGIRNYIIKSAKEGMHYELLCNEKSENCYSMHNKKSVIEKVEIAPSIIGSGPGTLAVLVGIAFIAGGIVAGATALGAFFVVLGVGLLIAGIMYLLTPIPENEPSSDVSGSVKNSSFLFQNPQNIATQGRTLPVCYGKLRVGSYVVGTTISNYNLNQDVQSQRRFESDKANASLKIQESFGSSVSNLYRFL